jgi:hypothetical protein
MTHCLKAPRALGIALLTCIAGGSFAADSNAQSAREFRDDPPAAVTPRSDPRARSPGRVVNVGPYVSVQVNVDALGRNIVGDAANESSIAVNPANPGNMVIGWRQFDSIASNFREGGWAFTLDGGESWSFPGVLENGIFRSDPVLDSDSNGNFYYQSLRETFDVDVFKSTDGGLTWGPPVPEFGGDKNWLAIDKSGGIGDGNLYGIWQRFFGCCGRNTFTRSTNGGSSFEFPVQVAFDPTFGTMAVGPDGEVYATGIDGTFFQNFNQFVIARSTNAEDPLLSPTFLGAQIEIGGAMELGAGFGTPNPDGLLGQANVAVDPSDESTRGNVYVLASVDPPGSDPLDVHIIRSSDRGASWSQPIRVNSDPDNSGAWQWFGAHSVAPNGRIDVVWNDTRNTGLVNVSELFYAYSNDTGQTWQGNIPVSPPFNSHIGFPNQNKIGDYYTLVSNRSGADVAYSATFNGEQDVYYLRAFPDCNENGISDVDDIDDGASFDDNGNHVPDECELDLAMPIPGLAGQNNTISVSLGTPAETVFFAFAQSGGTTPVNVCVEAVGLDAPNLLGSAVADAGGVATITRFVPGEASGRTVVLQAVEASTCKFSNVVTFTFP